MRAPLGPTGAYAALAAADTVLAGRGDRRSRRVTKPLLMPALVAGLAAGGLDDRAVRRTIAAQALSWGGDVALMAPGRGPFLAGLGSFLGAHLAYVGAFRARSAAPLLGSPARRAALAGGAGLAVGMGVVASRRSDPRLAGPVAAYGLVLTTMAVTSATLPAGPGRRRALAGTSLFLLSDALLGAGRFLLADAPPALDAAVMATYTAGQWCIAAGVSELATAGQGGWSGQCT